MFEIKINEIDQIDGKGEKMETTEQFYTAFESIFGHPGEALYFSPGRVNLIGEHTDYNGGKVFPCAISMGTYGVISQRNDQKVQAYSENFAEMGIRSFTLSAIRREKQNDWTKYIQGMLLYMQEMTGAFPHGFNIYINGTIPNGASLSSSASLEVLIGTIANELYGLDLSQETIATLGMRVENEFLNLSSGIMDQFIIAHGKKDHALLLDTNNLKYEQVPLNLDGYTLIIMNSLKRRELVDSEYNQRQKECQTALKMLQQVVSINTLGELTEIEFEQYNYAITDNVAKRRAKHAVYENQRTAQAVDALKENHLEVFGQLMNESHISLHEDYEVTVDETDQLVRSAWEQEGVLGARMTGGGFGGCCIAIVETEYVEAFTENVKNDFHTQFGYEPEFYQAETASHTRKI